ncbi:hypothetical protein [Sulfurimonas sp.]|jgi:hypothetical protein|uniref:hypothetical protein n=1 Tax=Sulfurimonas sp. TaxID=2022749 RepID=UPI0025E1ECCC|nr:hypothetical protein [Sulfurimonas sp.]MBT5935167.1 hypothetical protein [Sulfurimonas sp.]
MIDGFVAGLDTKYRNIFIIDSMSYWKEDNDYNSKTDLVLTYDLELHKAISILGGNVFYIDHIVDSNRMQKNNFLIYKFFKNWHFDRTGNDIFVYKDVPFGLALRLEYWNDFTTYIRLYLSLSCLKKIEMDKLYLSTTDKVILEILNGLKIPFVEQIIDEKSSIGFYFPIQKWMDERIRPSGLRAFLYKTREIVSYYYGLIRSFLDNLFTNNNIQTVFIQEYHPTKKILAHLREDNNIRVLLTNFSRGSKLRENLSERLVPIGGRVEKYDKVADSLIHEMSLRKNEKLILDDGSDISIQIYNIIENRIAVALPNILRTLDSSILYFNKNKVDLEILIANIGHAATLFDCVCKVRNIPSYLIINGFLGSSYSDDSRYANYINSYSTSIKENYFRGNKNIVTLGDSRMDAYRSSDKPLEVNRIKPTVTIGASGFNSTNLSSYVAVEFDFMYDIVSALNNVIIQGTEIDIIIKVRPNGYKSQYQKFISKYFGELNIKIIDNLPMRDVLERTDFYISIYSQTLFEASCLGIPVVYYKKDTEIMDPPFNNNSELVTATDKEDMIQAFYDFKNNHKRYEPFLNRKIMEKYIGPLDGKNLERNLKFVYELLDKPKQEKNND